MAGEREGEGKGTTEKKMDGRIKSNEMEEPNVKLEEGREKGVER